MTAATIGSMAKEIFRPSGGVLYHWRARRSANLWQGFCEPLTLWLESWPIPRSELILIGPSAGYTLPDQWLNTFAKVVAVDSDPLAPWLFRRRHRQVQVSFVRQDAFWRDQQLSLVNLNELLAAYPHAAILFCNLLGQLPLEHQVNERRWQQFLRQLRAGLNGRRWASYHDLYTVEPLNQQHHLNVVQALTSGENLEHSLQSAHSTRLEVIDHMMGGRWSEGLSKHLFAWSLTSRCLHVIEGVR